MTYTLIQRSKGPAELLGRPLTLAGRAHARDGLVSARDTKALVPDMADATAEPIAAFFVGFACALPGDSGRNSSHAGGGDQSNRRVLHLDGSNTIGIFKTRFQLFSSFFFCVCLLYLCLFS